MSSKCISWQNHKLGELYDISSGLSKKRSEFGFGYPFLSFKEVFNNYFIPNSLENLANTSEKERVKYSIEEGDIFLTRTSERANELGMSCVALKEYDNATFNGFTKRLRKKIPNVDIDNLFIGYCLRNKRFRNQVVGMATMTTRASLNNSMIDRLEISIPPIKVQRKIGRILKALDDKIETNNHINRTLEEMSQAIFKHWFVDFEFSNKDGQPYKFNGGKMIDSELGLIPEGWEIKILDDVSEVVGGATPSKKIAEYYTSHGIPWVTPKDLSRNRNKFISRGETDITDIGYKKSSTRILPKGSILFSSRAPIGYVAIAKNDLTTNQGFKSLIPKEDISNEFLYYLLKYLTPTIESHASGSTFKEISGKGMKSIKFLYPGLPLIKKFNKVINSFSREVMFNEEETERLISIRDALLPKLMNGDIEV